MDSSDTQSPHTLTDEQMAILVVVTLEEFGAELTRTQFNEVMLAIFEHIPRFETLARKRSVQYLKSFGRNTTKSFRRTSIAIDRHRRLKH